MAVWDCAIKGAEDCTKKKPDMLLVYAGEDGKRYSLHIEVDEDDDHEDDDTRVADVQKAVGSVHHFLVRVKMTGAYRSKRLCNGESCIVATESFAPLMARMIAVLREAWTLVKSGTAPTVETWKTVVSV